jgi:hypothetical protein
MTERFRKGARVKDPGKTRQAGKPSESERDHPRLWVSLMVIFVLLILMALGQWDFVLAGFIGLIVGNGLVGLTGR